MSDMLESHRLSESSSNHSVYARLLYRLYSNVEQFEAKLPPSVTHSSIHGSSKSASLLDRSTNCNYQLSTTLKRVIRRSRKELNVVNGRTRPLRRRRSFGQSRSVPPDIIRERVLQWRASIYEQLLQAVPCSMRSFCEQSEIAKSGVKERIRQKIEPWIRRELQAITGDPDPSIIVHVGTTLFISSLEEKHKVSSGHSGLEDNYLEPLRPFLLERTSMFWHELRCFAESSFNMDTYDTVVEYIMHTD